MKRTLIVLVAMFACAALPAQERIALTVPPPAASELRVESVYMLWGPMTVAVEGQPSIQTCEITVTLRPDTVGAMPVRRTYSGDVACIMLRALNKANLSTTSLHRRIIERLIADKIIAGSVTGTPE